MLLRKTRYQWMQYLIQGARFSSTPNFYDSTIEKQASTPIKKLTLTQMLSIGQLALKDDAVLFKHARYVQSELPKRLARRLLDLRFLPHVIITNPHIRHVYEVHYKAFRTFLELREVRSLEQNQAFTDVLRQLLDQHVTLLDTLAAGLRECLVKKSLSDKVDLQPFLEGMLRSRLSRRVLAGHHIGLHDRPKGFIGCVCTDLDVKEAITGAAARAQSVCKENYGHAPEVYITSTQPVLMSYIPVHLDYVLYELFKNSMRAVLDHNSSKLPPINIKICESDSDVTIRISDEGGGIKPEILNEIWGYGFSTSSNLDFNGSHSFLVNAHSQGSISKLYGYGFGLPFSRLHARYFGGDIQLVSMPGYGVDTFLTIKKLQKQDWQEDKIDIDSSEKLIYTGIESF